MDEKLIEYSFKKFHIIFEEIDDNDVRVILQHEKDGFAIRFAITILEIKKVIQDLELIGNNIENNSLNRDGIIKQLIDVPPLKKMDSDYYSNILQFEATGTTDDQLPTIDLMLNDAFISIPFVNLNELKEFCNIFKQMVLNIFSQFDVDFNNIENVNSNISQVMEELGQKEKLDLLLVERQRAYEELQPLIIKSFDNFIKKMSPDEFQKYIIKKINEIPLYHRVNPNIIHRQIVNLIKDIVDKKILIDIADKVDETEKSWYFRDFGRYLVTPLQKKYSDIIREFDYGRRLEVVHQAQEEASEIILEQLKTHKKITKSLIKALLIKNQFSYTTLQNVIYLKYLESLN